MLKSELVGPYVVLELGWPARTKKTFTSTFHGVGQEPN